MATDDDYKPSPREPLHTDPQLCKGIISAVVSAFPLEIRTSDVANGSGVFAAANIEAGCEIYHSKDTILAAIDFGNPTFCHSCLQDTSNLFGNPTKTESPAKACTGCKVARFCSKVATPQASMRYPTDWPLQECQKTAWGDFHKDECKILKKAPMIKAHNLLAHRVVFRALRGLISKAEARAMRYHLETHFCEYSQDAERCSEILNIAGAIQAAADNKMDMGLIWKLVSAMRINCVRIRPASKKESVGYVFHWLTAAVNHSCDPNAFVFFDGRQLKVRSLREIVAGDEITICYLDPTLDVAARKKILRRGRCKSDLGVQETFAKIASSTIETIARAQHEIVALIRSAVHASKHPGIYPPRLALALLYLDQFKPVPALRLALRGRLLRKFLAGPDWINEMLDVVVTVLLVAGSMPPDAKAFEDKAFPTSEELRTVMYGYLYVVCREVGRVFGVESGYAKAVGEMFARMVEKKDGERPGGKRFKGEFEAAQKRVLRWAGVDEDMAVRIGY
ncbi:hypothetical protein N0V88_007849 [Collariella sp. IMI 366227]|nr:hypothetical protein N0V88_007849 [Collariella sp. IMI 366227]